MNKVVILTLFLMLIVYCSHAQNLKTQNKQYGTYMAKKELVVNKSNNSYNIILDSGNNLVFTITTTSGGDPRNDTQIKELIYFEIPVHKNHFSIDSTFKKHHIFLERVCRCVDAGFNQVISGFINGVKNDNKWELNVDVKAVGHDTGDTYELNFSGLASLKTK